MGNFAVKIEGVGGHGCNRAAGDGEMLAPMCESEGCPDCMVRRLVADMSKRGMVTAATFTHWPGDPGEVVDDFYLGTRKGSFAPPK
jgi:hypothetical protein